MASSRFGCGDGFSLAGRMRDRRRQSRLRSTRLVQVAHEGDAAYARCRDLSDTGMKLDLTAPHSLDQLRASLLKDFAGLERSVAEIYERHSVDTPYVMKNYKESLAQLETEKKIAVRSLKGARRKGTFADHLLVRFPVNSIDGE